MAIKPIWWAFLLSLNLIACGGEVSTFEDIEAGRGELPQDEIDAVRELIKSANISPKNFKILTKGSLDSSPNGININNGHVTAIRISRSGLTDMKAISGLKSLRAIRFSSNKLTTIAGLENLDKLVSLDLRKNKITSLDGLKGCRSLKLLVLKNNEISSTKGIENAKNLSKVDLSSNQLTDISSLSGLKRLSFLDLSKNKLIKLSGFGGFPELQNLDLSHNALTSFEGVKNLPKLRTLFAHDNQITSIDGMLGLKSLLRVDLSNNKLTSLPEKLGTITQIVVKGNPLPPEVLSKHSKAKMSCIGNVDKLPGRSGSTKKIQMKCSGSCRGDVSKLKGTTYFSLRSPYRPVKVRIESKRGTVKAYLKNPSGGYQYAQASPDESCTVRGIPIVAKVRAKRRRGQRSKRPQFAEEGQVIIRSSSLESEGVKIISWQD